MVASSFLIELPRDQMEVIEPPRSSGPGVELASESVDVVHGAQNGHPSKPARLQTDPSPTQTQLLHRIRDVDRNLELYLNPAEESTRAVFTQFLFSYEVNPRTVLFAGYSDNRLGLTEVDMTTTDRSFFLKLGYAWRP